MLARTSLLVSTDPSLIEAAGQARDAVQPLRLEVRREVEEALPLLQQEDLALVMLHLTADSDDAEVTRFLMSAAAQKPSCPVILLSEQYRDHQAVAFLRAGATDYLGLPLAPARLTYLMDTLTLRARLGLRPKAAEVGPVFTKQDPFHFVLAPEMVELMEQVRRVGPQDTTLLLTGETGTGKTRLARLIHELSPRRDEPFLVVDCGALSPTLIESEMFGHVRGAFTGADRDRPGKFAAVGAGTLLLDEVNSLPRELQGKLLRAVDERLFEPVGSDRSQRLRARIIAVSNVPLADEVAAERFRADLHFRLDVVGFCLPPLRERRSCIPSLTQKFLAELIGRNRPDVRGITPAALEALQAHSWPGNVRELRNVIERALALCPGPEVQLADLPEELRRAPSTPAPIGEPVRQVGGDPAPPRPTLAESLKAAEIRKIKETLAKHNNNRLRAANELGISRMGLYKKLHRYGLTGS
jgi:DNA-binding NtrC family response regulator